MSHYTDFHKPTIGIQGEIVQINAEWNPGQSVSLQKPPKLRQLEILLGYLPKQKGTREEGAMELDALGLVKNADEDDPCDAEGVHDVIW